MRRLLLAASLVASLASTVPALAQTGPLTVPIDQSVRVGLGGKARDLVIGNPMIADVTLLDSGSAVILGREYGQTTVTAFDTDGRMIFSRQVLVMANDDHRVAVFRGAEINNYSCATRCERAPMPGEDKFQNEDKSSAYTSYAARAQAAVKPAGQP